MTEEINSETAEAHAETVDAGGFKNPPLRGAPETTADTPVTVIARSEATKQSIASAPENKPDERLLELETALNETRQSLAARTGDYDRLKATLDDTVSAYRKLAVSSSPLYSDDMISGSSVEEIDASIKKVNGLVKKMRSSLEAELKDLTIPAGAPERSAPDLSGLSPRDKIKYGIQDKNK
jgi:hypothetical protein